MEDTILIALISLIILLILAEWKHDAIYYLLTSISSLFLATELYNSDTHHFFFIVFISLLVYTLFLFFVSLLDWSEDIKDRLGK